MRLLGLLALTATAAASVYENVTLPSGIVLSVLLGGAASNPNVPTIVFLHGFPEGSWSWQAVMAGAGGALSEYRLVTPDLRGYNRSALPGRYEIDRIADDVTALISIVARGAPVHLVAHDWGGAVAWWIAAGPAAAVLRSLTIINMAHPRGWIAAVRGDAMQQAASAYVLSFVNPLFTDYLLADNFKALKAIYGVEPFFNATEPAYVSSWSVAGTVDASLNWYRHNIIPLCPLSCTAPSCWTQGVNCTFDEMPLTVREALPVRVLWGMRDTAFDNAFQLAFIQDVCPAANVSRFDSHGHWLAQEAPDEVAAAIAAFVGMV